MGIVDIFFICFLSQKQWQTSSKSSCHTMGKINVLVSTEKNLNKSILYITADVFRLDLHVGCTEHIWVGKAVCSMFVCVIGCTQCIQSSTCFIQKYPLSYVTLGHCAVFCTRVHACMFSNTVLNKSILLSTYLMNYYIAGTFKYTVYNDYRNKRSCTVHQSTNIQISKVCSQVWIKLHIIRTGITVGLTLAKQACKITFLI